MVNQEGSPTLSHSFVNFDPRIVQFRQYVIIDNKSYCPSITLEYIILYAIIITLKPCGRVYPYFNTIGSENKHY